MKIFDHIDCGEMPGGQAGSDAGTLSMNQTMVTVTTGHAKGTNALTHVVASDAQQGLSLKVTKLSREKTGTTHTQISGAVCLIKWCTKKLFMQDNRREFHCPTAHKHKKKVPVDCWRRAAPHFPLRRVLQFTLRPGLIEFGKKHGRCLG